MRIESAFEFPPLFFRRAVLFSLFPVCACASEGGRGSSFDAPPDAGLPDGSSEDAGPIDENPIDENPWSRVPWPTQGDLTGVSTIAPDQVWISGTDGIFLFDGASVTRSYADSPIYDITDDAWGPMIAVGGSDAGRTILTYLAGSWRLPDFEGAEIPEGAPLEAVHQSAAGIFWARSNVGEVLRFDPDAIMDSAGFVQWGRGGLEQPGGIWSDLAERTIVVSEGGISRFDPVMWGWRDEVWTGTRFAGGYADVFATATNDLWVVGGRYGAATLAHFDGSRWRQWGDETTPMLHAVHAFGPDDCWAVGAAGSVRHWNGVRWAPVDIGASVDLLGIGASAPDDIWIVGAEGSVFHCQDADCAFPWNCADEDGDGHRDIACGGDDCDDADAAIHPGASDEEWSYETVDTDGGGSPSIALDAEGTAHVLYRSASGSGETRYATNTAGAWSVEALPETTGDSAIVLDLADDLLVALWSLDGSLATARRGADGWTVDPIEEIVGGGVGVSPAVGPDGGLRVAYLNGGLWLASGGDGAWSQEFLAMDHHANRDVDIAIGGDGSVHIVWAGQTLNYMTNAGGGWRGEWVDRAGTLNPMYSSIAIDPDGTPHIAYLGIVWERPLTYTTRTVDGWEVETIDAGATWGGGNRDFPFNPSGVSPESLVIMEDGTVVVLYSDDAGDLRVGIRSAEGWISQVVAAATASRLTMALDVGPDGEIYAVFDDARTNDLRVAHSSALPDGIDQDCSGPSP